MQNDAENTDNQTLDKIENAKPKAKKPKVRLSLDLVVGILLVITTLATIVWWYLAISKA